MGESSACLVRSLSQPSPTSSEEKKGNTLQRALTTSVSFGRFMSESLDWDRWSAFTQNRHLEEVERYSKPGSVAEKKAYFEAHFKRRRAAALLEQQIAAASDLSETSMENIIEDSSPLDSDLGVRDNSYVVTENSMEEVVQNNDPVYPEGQNGSCDASEERISENPVELANHHLQNDGFNGDIVLKKEDKDDSSIRNTAPSSVKKKTSVKQIIMPIQLKNSEDTPQSKSNAKESSNKSRSHTTSLHVSINFASCSSETRKGTSPGVPKIPNSRLIKAPAKKYKNNLLPEASTRASVNDIFKHHLAIPPAENKRTMIPNGDSISRSRTFDGKVQSTSTYCSKSSSTFGSKAPLPSVSSSFTFKSEERAEKRREFFQKLEQKSKPKDMEKQQQLHAKSQVRRSYCKDLRNSISSKATKDVKVPTKTELPSNITKKISIPRPKIEERAALKVQDNDTRPRWNLSVKPQGLKDFTVKNSYSAKFSLKKNLNENASPNIQQL